MKVKDVVMVVLVCLLENGVFAQQNIPLTIQGKLATKSENKEQTIIPDPKSGSRIVYNVTNPSLSIYKPEKDHSNGIAVLVCPGGAFHILAYDDEGVTIAKELAAKGYTAAVLKYRLVPVDSKDPFGKLNQYAKNLKVLDSIMAPVVPLAIEDGKTAMRYLKQNAGVLGFEDTKVGVIGFSAGGTIAAALAIDPDPQVQPLFSAPIYPYLEPVINTAVPALAPPLFIAVTEDDDFGFDINSLKLYQRWKSASGLAELHVYPKGRHGFASKKQQLPVDHWMERFTEWLVSMGYSSK
jgi:acetyl esterase/lipase